VNNVQIFGTKNSAATRAAERFFKERRVPIQFADLQAKPMAAGEIRRFIQKFTLAGLLDTSGKAYEDAGLKYLKLTEDELLARIEREPRLLKLPLVRGAAGLAIGHDEAAWKALTPAATPTRATPR
jgi:arsenate reductase-like glutaredoxin family protein